MCGNYWGGSLSATCFSNCWGYLSPNGCPCHFLENVTDAGLALPPGDLHCPVRLPTQFKRTFRRHLSLSRHSLRGETVEPWSHVGVKLRLGWSSQEWPVLGTGQVCTYMSGLALRASWNWLIQTTFRSGVRCIWTHNLRVTCSLTWRLQCLIAWANHQCTLFLTLQLPITSLIVVHTVWRSSDMHNLVIVQECNHFEGDQNHSESVMHMYVCMDAFIFDVLATSVTGLQKSYPKWHFFFFFPDLP